MAGLQGRRLARTLHCSHGRSPALGVAPWGHLRARPPPGLPLSLRDLPRPRPLRGTQRLLGNAFRWNERGYGDDPMGGWSGRDSGTSFPGHGGHEAVLCGTETEIVEQRI